MRHLLYRGELRGILGDESAAQDLRNSAALAARLALTAYQARAHVVLAELALRGRHHDEARLELARARPLAQLVDDRVGDAMAAILDMRLGADVEDLPATIERLGLPSLSVSMLVALSIRALTTGDDRAAEAHAANALELCDTADIPLGLHLQSMALANNRTGPRELVRSIAEHFPDRRNRRRFVRTWAAVGNI